MDPRINDDEALQELVAQMEDLQSVVDTIVRLRSDNLFRYLSKPARNILLSGLIEKSGTVEDAAKATYRAIKKTKRENLPDEIADLLLTGRKDLAIVVSPFVTGTAPIIEAE